MYPGKATIFMNRFDEMKSVIIKYLKSPQVVKHPATKKMLANIESSSENLKAIYLMHGLCAAFYSHFTCSFKNQENRKARYSFTVEDCQTAFFILCPSVPSIDDMFNKKIESFYQMGMTIQPFIFSIGDSIENCQQFVVALDHLRYPFQSYFDALFFLIRVYFVFNLSFPKYCSQVFEFLQKFLFHINTDYDANYPEVKNAMKIISGLPKQ
jgi:hypothetical protein